MTLLVVIHIVICVFLVCVILLQPGKGDAGIGFGSSSQSIFGSAGAGKFPYQDDDSLCESVYFDEFSSYPFTNYRIQWQRDREGRARRE